jgi:hypothetical protein
MSNTIEAQAPANASNTNETAALHVPAPHPVTFTQRTVASTITEITTHSGLVIQRGHQLANKRPRRNLKDFYANFQIGDVVNVATQREAFYIYLGMRSRNGSASTRKQSNGTFNVQRTA